MSGQEGKERESGRIYKACYQGFYFYYCLRAASVRREGPPLGHRRTHRGSKMNRLSRRVMTLRRRCVARVRVDSLTHMTTPVCDLGGSVGVCRDAWHCLRAFLTARGSIFRFILILICFFKTLLIEYASLCGFGFEGNANEEVC